MGGKGNRYEEVGARCPDLRLVTVHLTVRPSAARMFNVAFAEGLMWCTVCLSVGLRMGLCFRVWSCFLRVCLFLDAGWCNKRGLLRIMP